MRLQTSLGLVGSETVAVRIEFGKHFGRVHASESTEDGI
jgi:hypothetical protein